MSETPEGRKPKSAFVPAADRASAEWDVRAGPGNYAWMVVAQGASALVSFLTAWWATRRLGGAEYGGVVALLAVSQTVSHLALQWSGTALVRFGAEEFVSTGQVTRTFWARTWVLASCLVAAVATSILWLPILAGWLQVPRTFAPLVLAHLAATAVFAHSQFALQAAKLPRMQAALQLLERVGVFGGVLLVGAGTQPNLFVWILPYILSPLLSAACAWIPLSAHIGPPGACVDSVGRVLRFSYPLIPFFAVGYFSSSQLDAFFLLRSLTHRELASYSISYQAAGALMQLAALAGSLQLPFLVTRGVAGRTDGTARLFGSILPLVCLGWAVACVVAGALASILLPALLGPSLHDAGALMWPFTAAAALAAPVLLGYGPLTNARSATTIAMTAGVVSAAVNVGLNFLLIPRYGLLGCAWATAAAYAVSLMLMEGRARRLIAVPAPRIAWTCLPAVAAAAVAGLGGGTPIAVLAGVAAAAIVAGLLRPSISQGWRIARQVGAQLWRREHISSARS